MDAVVIARLTKLSEVTKTLSGSDDVPKATFEVIEVLKGSASSGEGQQIRTVIYGQEQVGDRFLIMGVGRPDVSWTTPMKVSERAIAYLRQLDALPEKGPERLAFFQTYLEDADQLLSRDAYDEFARAPYSEVKGLGDKMDHGQLLAWIKNPDTQLNRKRLYMVMLSACGDSDDLPMLEQMLRSEDRKTRSGLDAMLGCYLMLAGKDGMTLVEDLFLKNSKADYADVYAAIMALRFLGTETQTIPRARILEGFHTLLDRPELADLVIPDLARWEDWSQAERLVKLFQEADKKSSGVRVPIVNYLRNCPRPEATNWLAELAKIDPQAVQRAEMFYPFGGGNSPAPSAVATGDGPNGAADKPSPAAAATEAKPEPNPTANSAVNAPTESAGKLPVLHRTGTSGANPLTYLVVFWVGGAVFFVVQWAVLAGFGRGS